jgi:Ca-activated chloride channel family protein
MFLTVVQQKCASTLEMNTYFTPRPQLSLRASESAKKISEMAKVRAFRGLLLTTSILLLAVSAAGSQNSNGTESNGQTYIIHQRVEEVLLYCTVIGHKGELVIDLDRSAFKVLEDKKPATITHFARKDVPVSLALMLDDSGSMKEKRTAVQGAALTLIKASNPEDETSVTNFADKAYVDQELTGDVTQLADALGKNKTISGGTALFDTVIAGADHLATTAHRSKQVIVIVTDGNDNASEADLAAAIRRVQHADGPVIYAIGLLYDVPSSQERRAHKELLSLAEETGGIAFFPSSVSEVDRIAAEVARDIRNQYAIAFRPAANAASGSYHSVAVTASAASHSGLTVRTRKGYLRTTAEQSPGH